MIHEHTVQSITGDIRFVYMQLQLQLQLLLQTRIYKQLQTNTPFATQIGDHERRLTPSNMIIIVIIMVFILFILFIAIAKR